MNLKETCLDDVKTMMMIVWSKEILESLARESGIYRDERRMEWTG